MEMLLNLATLPSGTFLTYYLHITNQQIPSHRRSNAVTFMGNLRKRAVNLIFDTLGGTKTVENTFTLMITIGWMLWKKRSWHAADRSTRLAKT